MKTRLYMTIGEYIGPMIMAPTKNFDLYDAEPEKYFFIKEIDVDMPQVEIDRLTKFIEVKKIEELQRKIDLINSEL